MRGPYHLGIDLGTTFTAAAVVRDGRAETINLGTRAAAIPSVVFLRDDGQWLVGEAAERRGMSDPNRLAREFKRRFGDPVPIIVGGTPQSPEALTARLLRHVYDTVVERQGGPPDRLVLTHPANWGPYKVDLLRMAVRLAELEGAGEVAFTSEPEAAAIHYATEQAVPIGAIVAVYDLGGGTFDAAVLRRTASGFEVLGEPEGIERLGGIDIDAAVLDHARLALGPAFASLDPDDPVALAALVNLRRACVDAKEALSSDFDTSFTVVLPNGPVEVRMTRAELESRVRPALDDTVAATRRALASAGVGPGALHTVLLVGGSSRIPLVGQVVQAAFGADVALDVDPKHAVAQGAAVLARQRATGNDVTVVLDTAPPEAAAPTPPGPPVPPAPDLPPVVPVVPVAPPPPADPPPPPDVEPAPAASGDGGPPRRRPVVPIVSALVVVAIVAGVLLTRAGDDGRGAAGAGATTTTAGADVTTTTAVAETTTTAAPVLTPTTLPPAEVDEVLFESFVGGDNAIWAAGPDGSDPHPLIDSSGVDGLPTISPDRRRVAYIHGDNGEFSLRVADADGSGTPITLLETTAVDHKPGWLPDSSAVVTALDEGLAIIPLDTLVPEPIELDDPFPCFHNDANISPDGTKVAYRCSFTVAGRQEDELFLADLATGEVTRLTDSPGIESDPWFLRDAEHLLFRSDRDGDPEIFEMDADGSNVRQLTHNETVDQDPVVLPDGRVLFSAGVGDGENDILELDVDTGAVSGFLVRPGLDLVPAG